MGTLYVSVDTSGLVPWRTYVNNATRRAASMAGRDAIRAMRAEGSRRIRERKAMKVAHVNKAISLLYPSDKRTLLWRVKASGEHVPLAAFPHRQTKGPGRDEPTGRFIRGKRVRGGRGGVYVTVNKGKRTLVRGAFIATMRSGHVGVFRRTGIGRKRLPIREAFTTTVADAFRDAIPAITDRGREVFGMTFRRLMSTKPAAVFGAPVNARTGERMRW